MLKHAAALAAAAVAAATTLMAAPSTAAETGTLRVSDTAVATSTKITFTGKLSTKIERRVILQRQLNRGWAKAGEGETNKRGRFALSRLSPFTAGTYVFRVKAKRYEAGRATYKPFVTPTVRLTVSAPATTPPPPAQPGTPPPLTTPPTPPALGSRENPYSINTPFFIGDWRLSIGAADFDAWPEIAAENMYNEPPATGWSYVTTPVTYHFLGSDTGLPWLDTDLQFVGNNGVVYDQGVSGHYCGVVPDQVSDLGDMYAGATVTGVECAPVLTSAIAGGSWRMTDDRYPIIWRFVRAG